MAYKTFVNGYPLNASELNEYLMNQSIAVFVDATARTAAISTPVEGQFTYLTGTDVLQKWTGSAWETVGSLPTLTASRAVATDGSGALTASTVTATELGYLSGVTSSIQTQLASAGSLVKIAAQSFTSSTSVNINSVFSSTYRNYKVMLNWVASANSDLNFRMTSSGTDNTSAYQLRGYWGNNVNLDHNTNYGLFGSAHSSGSPSFTDLSVSRPFDSVYTGFAFLHSGEKSAFYNGGGLSAQGFHTAATSFDGFRIYPSTGNITGTLTVYGLVN